MLRILGRASSINVRKVLWTCAELNLPYEREDWGSGFRSTASAEFIALNPNAMVPVLVDGDFVLWESNAICSYLASQYPLDELLPNSPRERALVGALTAPSLLRYAPGGRRKPRRLRSPRAFMNV